MTAGPSRQEAVRALTQKVLDELEGLISATSMARDEATHGESRAENKYDTRAIEASYLAAGQGQRIEELRELLMWYRNLPDESHFERAETGALVGLEDEDGASRWVFLAKDGGTVATAGGVEVRAISPSSGLGAALLGLQEGDAGEVRTPKNTLEFEVIALR